MFMIVFEYDSICEGFKLNQGFINLNMLYSIDCLLFKTSITIFSNFLFINYSIWKNAS